MKEIVKKKKEDKLREGAGVCGHDEEFKVDVKLKMTFSAF